MGRFGMSSVGNGINLRVPVWFLFPTYLKVEKPAGETVCDAESSSSNEVPLENIEESQQFETDLVKRVAKVIEDLPSLESLPE